MTELEEVFQNFKRELGTDHCVLCGKPVAMHSAYGFPWCEEHVQHGKVFTWGAQHGFPEIHFHKYAMGPGEYCWWIPCIESASVGTKKADEDFIWMALAYVEHLDSLEKAS